MRNILDWMIVPMKRAAVYCRVSTLTQAQQGYSLGEQQEILPKLAVQRGYSLTPDDVFVETASGTKDDRPEYNRMLARIVEGQYQAVFVVEKSRLGRTESREEEERVIKTLQQFNCVVVTPYSTYDPSTLEGEFVWDVMSAVDRQERKRIKVRMLAGKSAKRRQGGYTGGNAPTGYRKTRDPETGKTRFILDLQAAEPVLLAYELAKTGAGYVSIAKELYQRGYASRMGRPYSPTTVMDWLSNPHYAGFTHSGYNRRSRKSQPGVELHEVNLFMEPLIPREEWREVQRLLQSRRARPGGTRHRLPLTGILLCPSCGRGMMADESHGRSVYVCSSRRKLGLSCDGSRALSIPVYDAHEMLLKVLPSIVRFVERHMDRLHERFIHRERLTDNKDAISRLNKAAADLKRRILNNMAEQEIAPSEIRRHRIMEQEQELTRTLAEIERLKESNIVPIPVVSGLDVFCETFIPDDHRRISQVVSELFSSVRWRRQGFKGAYTYRITSVTMAFGERLNLMQGTYPAFPKK